jgi:hypothetical protein
LPKLRVLLHDLCDRLNTAINPAILAHANEDCSSHAQ